jgi:hypothetical protein
MSTYACNGRIRYLEIQIHPYKHQYPDSSSSVHGLSQALSVSLSFWVVKWNFLPNSSVFHSQNVIFPRWSGFENFQYPKSGVEIRLYNKLRGFSPQANYTNRVTAACRPSWCQLFRIEGVAWSAQRIPTAVNLGFLDRSCYLSIQVVPQLFSRAWVDPVPDPLLLRKCGSPGNRTRDLWICKKKLWSLDHRGGPIALIKWRY